MKHPSNPPQLTNGQAISTEEGVVINQSIIASDSGTVKNATQQITIRSNTKELTSEQLFDACKRHVASIIRTVSSKYNPHLYVPRTLIQQEILSFFDASINKTNKNSLLIVAPAGSGKTNLLCELARLRVEQQPVLLLLGGNIQIPADTQFAGTIHTSLRKASSASIASDPYLTLHKLNDLANELNQEILIFIDAINEFTSTEEMLHAIEDLSRLVQGNKWRCKILLTCRDHYWSYFKAASFWDDILVNSIIDESDSPIPESVTLANFSSAEYRKARKLYFKHYNITGKLHRAVTKQCKHPLLFRFFCEAYQGTNIEALRAIHLKDLFDLYWTRKLDSIADKLIKEGIRQPKVRLINDIEAYLFNIATYLLQNKVQSVKFSALDTIVNDNTDKFHLNSIYARIRDEFIILEEHRDSYSSSTDWHIAFVYEAFMEYVMARALYQRWYSEGLDKSAILSAINDRFEKYDSFMQLLGVMLYLAVFLKEPPYKLSLWGLLLQQKSQWHEAVFRAIRKLSSAEFTDDLFTIFERNLVGNDRNLKILTLDTLKVKRIGTKITPTITSALYRLLLSWDESLSRRAALALAHNPSQETLEIFAIHYRQLKSHTRHNIDVSLTRLGKRYEAWSLIGQQDGVAAVNICGNHAINPLIFALREKLISSTDFISAIAQLNSQAVPILIDLLSDSSKYIRNTAFVGLKQLEASNCPALTIHLNHKSKYVRASIALILSDLRFTQSIPLISHLLKDRTALVRKSAATSLGQFKSEQAVEPLIIALNDSRVTVQIAIIQALGQIGSTAATNHLFPHLNSKHLQTKLATLDALACINDLRAVEHIAKLLHHGNSIIEKAAIRTLSLISTELSHNFLLEHLKRSNTEISSLILTILPNIRTTSTATKISHYLTETNTQKIRVDALNALSSLGGDEVVELIIDYLSDESIQTHVSNVLGNIADPSHIDQIASHLEDISDVKTLISTINVLGMIGHVQAIDYLRPLTSVPNAHVQKRLSYALYKINDPKIIPLSVALLDSPFHVVRIGAVWLLDTFKWEGRGNNVQNISYQIAKGNWSELVLLGDQSISRLVTHLTDRDSDFRYGVASCLEQIGWKPTQSSERVNWLVAKREWELLKHLRLDTVLQLAYHLDDEGIKVHILAALCSINDACVAPYLIKALSTAIDAAGKLDDPLLLSMINTLGQVKSHEAIPVFHKYLSHNDVELDQFSQQHIHHLRVDSLNKKIIEALCLIGDSQTLSYLGESLLVLVHSNYPAYRSNRNISWLFETLSSSNHLEATTYIEQALPMSSNEWVFRSGFRALKTLDETRIVPCLMKCLDSTKQVKRYAAQRLADLGGSTIVDNLFIHLNESNTPEIAFEILLSIVPNAPSHISEKHIDELIEYAFKEIWHNHVVQILIYLSDRAANRILQILDRTEDGTNRNVLLHLLSNLVMYSDIRLIEEGSIIILVKLLIQGSSQEQQIATQCLSDAKAQVIPFVSPLLSYTDMDVRRRAAYILERIDWEPLSQNEKILYLIAQADWLTVSTFGTAAVEPLLQCLNISTESHDVIIETLGIIRDPKAIPFLLTYIQSPDVFIRAAALSSIREFDDKVIIESLLPYDDDSIRLTILKIFPGFKQRGVNDLIDYLEHENPLVRIHAANILIDIGYYAAIPLVDHLKHHSRESISSQSLIIDILERIGWNPTTLHEKLLIQSIRIRIQFSKINLFP